MSATSGEARIHELHEEVHGSLRAHAIISSFASIVEQCKERRKKIKPIVVYDFLFLSLSVCVCLCLSLFSIFVA